MNDFNTNLKLKTKEVEDIIYNYFPKEEGKQKIIIEAMNYSLKAGGKRLRPMLIMETAKLFKDDVTNAYPFMAAIEMIHTYSLVHDDLPAMDNDEYRRGKKTTHVFRYSVAGLMFSSAAACSRCPLQTLRALIIFIFSNDSSFNG